MLGGKACVGEEFLAAETLAPGGYAHRHAQWAALSRGLDLDRVKPREGAARDDLATLLVGAGKQNEQLSIGGVTDAVEGAQLTAERLGEVGERFGGHGLAVGACKLVDLIELEQQATQRCAVA
jgi:hypothetical protein